MDEHFFNFNLNEVKNSLRKFFLYQYSYETLLLRTYKQLFLTSKD
jgi:hypothetical protein